MLYDYSLTQGLDTSRLLFTDHLPDLPESPTEVTSELGGSWKTPDRSLLDTFSCYAKYCGDFINIDKHIVIESRQALKQFEVSHYNFPVKTELDADDFRNLLFRGGQLTPIEVERHLTFYGFAAMLDQIIHDQDARGISRSRDVLPLEFGTIFIRDMIRIVCHAADAANNPGCSVWGKGLSTTWDDSCKTCPRPSAPRQVACSVLFPASSQRQDFRKEAVIWPALVDEDHLKHWTSGSRPLPINRAFTAVESLHRRGAIPAAAYLHNMQKIEAYACFTRSLREVRNTLARIWPKMIEEDQTVVINWSETDHWYTRQVSEYTFEGNAIADLDSYPQAAGHDFFEIFSGQPNFKPVRLQSVPAHIEIRVTPFPLPIDPIEFHNQPQDGLALRLFIRPAKS